MSGQPVHQQHNAKVLMEPCRSGRWQASWSGTGMNMLVSLGNFGGYIIYRFDQRSPTIPTTLTAWTSWCRATTAAQPLRLWACQCVEYRRMARRGIRWLVPTALQQPRLLGLYHNTQSTGTSTVYGGASSTAADWTDSMGYSGTSYLYPNKALYPLFPWTAENDTSITVTGTLLGNKRNHS